MGASASVPAPVDDDNNSSKILPFPKNGVKLTYIKEFYDACGGREALEGLTTTEVSDLYVKSKTDHCKMSYCEMLEAQGHPSVGKATVFISHAWRYRFNDVVSALETHFKDAMDTVVWFDLFSNNQHKATVLPFEWWRDTFKSAIAEFGHTVMIFAPWNDPTPLTRGWCIWELYCTLATMSRFEIAMSTADQAQFIEDVAGDPQKVVHKMLATIDARKSECWKAEDRDRIHQVIHDTVGFSNVNDMVFSLMRDWVVNTTKAALETNADDEEELRLLQALASLYGN